MAARRLDRRVIADATGVKPRTVTNWTSGVTEPLEPEKAALRRILGDYDNPGDPVEVAVRSSELLEWRQDLVLAHYKRNLHEQRAQEAG